MMGKTHLATALGYAACQHVNGDATITSAVLDRLLHHAETIIMKAPAIG